MGGSTTNSSKEESKSSEKVMIVSMFESLSQKIEEKALLKETLYATDIAYENKNPSILEKDDEAP